MFFARTRTSLGTRVLGTALVAGLLLFSLHAKEGRDLSFLRTKAPSALLEEMALLTANPVYDYPLPVIVQLEPELFSQNGEPDAVNASGGREADSRLTLINAYRARLTAGQIEVLLRSVSVEYVTLDARIRATSDVAGNTNTFLSTIGIGNMGASGPNGSGIVVAVFDSGIGSHPDLQGEKRIRTAVDFTTGEPVQRSSNVDEYGHGTAVAGIIGGTGREGIPTGVAPGVQFVDVKVIGPDGTGSTSNLIKAIEGSSGKWGGGTWFGAFRIPNLVPRSLVNIVGCSSRGRGNCGKLRAISNWASKPVIRSFPSAVRTVEKQLRALASSPPELLVFPRFA